MELPIAEPGSMKDGGHPIRIAGGSAIEELGKRDLRVVEARFDPRVVVGDPRSVHDRTSSGTYCAFQNLWAVPSVAGMVVGDDPCPRF